MKVFKVNDCDWVAAKSFAEAKEWYMKETGVSSDECWLEYECSPDETMLVEIEYLSDEELSEAQKMKDGMIRKTFRWVMEHIYNNQQTPYIIASTEY